MFNSYLINNFSLHTDNINIGFINTFVIEKQNTSDPRKFEFKLITIYIKKNNLVYITIFSLY